MLSVWFSAEGCIINTLAACVNYEYAMYHIGMC